MSFLIGLFLFIGIPLIHFITGNRWIKIIALIFSSIISLLFIAMVVGATARDWDREIDPYRVLALGIVSGICLLFSLVTLKKKKLVPINDVIDSE